MVEQFTRASFESTRDVHALCRSLSEELTLRLQRASSPEAEIDLMVEELKALGHELYSWDHNPDSFQAWGDSYHEPKTSNRLLVEFSYDSESERSVKVHFGPWPRAQTPP